MLSEKTKTIGREELITQLYENAFPKVARFIHKMGGSVYDARDVFHDALVIWYEKKRDPGFTIQTDDASYLTGISKHLWYKKFRENHLNQRLVADNPAYAATDEPKVSENLLRYIEASGKKCLDLLTAFYYDKTNMKDLAIKFNFSGERSATAQKFKCLEKIRTAIKIKSLKKEDFYE